VLDTVALIVTELVTNAVLHAQTDLRLTIETRHGRVRIAVEDRAPSLPQPVHADPDALNGRGLALVEHLSSSWGVDASASGKVVWSEIAA
jgi:anti-sigma regulatory factor (Ser/Thr protein kinase)